MYPPGTNEQTFAEIPLRHREDAVQEAWVAHLEGRDPLLGARAYLKREMRHEYEKPNFTSLGLTK